MARSLLGKATCILQSGSYVDLILFLALILAPQFNFVTTGAAGVFRVAVDLNSLL